MDTQMFSALSEPNRLNIVELLYTNPQSVNEIVDKLQLNQPQVSKHLKVLADAGVVDVHPIANKRVYALRPEPFKNLDNWLEKFKDIWEEKFQRLDRVLESEVNKNGK